MQENKDQKKPRLWTLFTQYKANDKLTRTISLHVILALSMPTLKTSQHGSLASPTSLELSFISWKPTIDWFKIKPALLMKTLPSLQGHSLCSSFLTFSLNLGRDSIAVISEDIHFQILGLKYDKILGSL